MPPEQAHSVNALPATSSAVAMVKIVFFISNLAIEFFVS